MGAWRNSKSKSKYFKCKLNEEELKGVRLLSRSETKEKPSRAIKMDPKMFVSNKIYVPFVGVFTKPPVLIPKAEVSVQEDNGEPECMSDFVEEDIEEEEEFKKNFNPLKRVLISMFASRIIEEENIRPSFAPKIAPMG